MSLTDLTDSYVHPPESPPILLSPPTNDPPPPYPSSERRARILRSSHRQPRRGQGSLPGPSHTQLSSPDSAGRDVIIIRPAARIQAPQLLRSEETSETTPLLPASSPVSSTRRLTGRPRSSSYSSTVVSSSSAAPSFAQTVLSLFQNDFDDESDVDIYEALAGHHPHHSSQGFDHHRSGVCTPELQAHRWPLFSKHAWGRYFRPLTRRAYHAAVFHLLVLNFPYALFAWIYLFVFTLTGTTLLITLPLGAILCFLDLLGARALARGELALQTTFHGPLAYPLPYSPRPIFRRRRLPRPSDSESETYYETSFYKNTYSMFTDSTSYQALFYFLVVKPSITLGLSIVLVAVVPVSYVLVFPAPMVLRAVRKLGIWQANVAVEGLYLAMS
ncbi:hypothetical protein BJ138DRAFT_1007505 [Hygrophoropsis aurantiaca]|uniref:Uncharacterized protein n=1 Tax=Hygrophoropsis aurantiaca TaxID=72124 RepID=A0ACB8AD09_9AGAM|nr:hypothetical protein BJ138DRAFT_1007505 [Hygrophoropsis aurantiaca]